MPPNRFESEVESFLEGSHGDRTHIKRADHHTVTPLCGTLLAAVSCARTEPASVVLMVSRGGVGRASVVVVSVCGVFGCVVETGGTTVGVNLSLCETGQVLWSGVIVLCPSGWVMR